MSDAADRATGAAPSVVLEQAAACSNTQGSRNTVLMIVRPLER